MVLTILLIHLVILTGTVMHFDPGAFPAATPYTLFSGEWADGVEQYLTQHLGFHDTLFRIKSRADLFVGEKMFTPLRKLKPKNKRKRQTVAKMPTFISLAYFISLIH